MRYFAQVLAVVLGVTVGSVHANFTFTKIADTSTPVPGGTGNFNFFSFPVIGPQVVFGGAGPTSQGLYANGGAGVLDLYTTSTPIPDGTGNFTGLAGPPGVGNGAVSFNGSGSGDQQGVYTDIGGTLIRVADLTTPVPGASGNFTGFGGTQGGALTDGTSVVFGANGPGNLAGAYRFTAGTLSRVADTTTVQPGGTLPFDVVTNPDIDGDQTVFFGSRQGGPVGIYSDLGGALSVIADSNTPIPGGSGNFGAFGSPSISEGVVAFVGGISGAGGVYAWENGQLDVVADTNTPVPGGVGTFAEFGTEVSVDGGNFAFYGVDSQGTPGIYMQRAGTLLKVLDSNTLLDGVPIDPLSLGLSFNQLSGDTVAFYAVREQHGFGIWTATYVPEPSSLLGLAFLVGWKVRRRIS